MRVIYGITVAGNHIDTSNTLLGAKQYATRNGFTRVSKRMGYNAQILEEKVNGKWKQYQK